MKYDATIRDRILFQVYQCDEFRTTRKDEAHHVALLIDDDFVDGKVMMDASSEAVSSAIIYRLKRKGYEKVNQILTSALPVGPDYSDVRDDLSAVVRESERGHDKLIATLACGGIGLFFTFLGLVSDSFKGFPPTVWEYACACVALVSWGYALVSLLVSHLSSIATAEGWIAAIDKGVSNPATSNSSRKKIKIHNVVNAVLTIIGILSFAAFTAVVFSTRIKGVHIHQGAGEQLSTMSHGS